MFSLVSPRLRVRVSLPLPFAFNFPKVPAWRESRVKQDLVLVFVPCPCLLYLPLPLPLPFALFPQRMSARSMEYYGSKDDHAIIFRHSVNGENVPVSYLGLGAEVVPKPVSDDLFCFVLRMLSFLTRD